MPNFESPLWLLGLFGIPLVWWIHRFRNIGIDLPVSTVVLWQNIVCPENKGHRPTIADPLWRQRAVIITAIVLALTTPVLDSLPNRTAKVWFDHSLSMHTVEEKGTRIELGIQQLLSRLDTEEITQATVHSLLDFSHSLQLEPHASIQNKQALRRWLGTLPQTTVKALPTPFLSKHENWLVTDGADNRVQDWIDKARIDQIIQVGSTTENTALMLLSVRPSLTQTGFTGIANISNQGHKNSTRRLQIRAQDKAVGEWLFTLQPGEIKHHYFNIPLNDTGLIEARLLHPEGTTEDALANDDRLSLIIPSTKVAVTGNCGKPIQALLQALPGIRLVSSTSATLNIVCASEQPLTDNATIWFYTGGETQQINQLPFWNPSVAQLSQLSLQPAPLLVHTSQAPGLEQTLLTADGMPLISFQSTPERRMEVRLDINTPQLTEHPAFPTLVTGLMEFALEQDLLGRIHTIQRAPQETQITPRPLHIKNSTSLNDTNITASELTHWLIIAAIILLFFDLIRNKRVLA